MATLRFTMQKPPRSLRYEVNQRFKLHVRRKDDQAAAQVKLDLYDGITFINTLVDEPVTSTSHELFAASWLAEDLIDRTGHSIQLLVTATNVEVGGFAWIPEMLGITPREQILLVPTRVRVQPRTESRVGTIPSSGAFKRTINIPRRWHS